MSASRKLIIVIFLLGLVLPVRSLASAQAGRPVIVLDPGHGHLGEDGEIDPGVQNGNLVEKDINLEVAKQAREILDRCPVDVFLTREGDSTEESISDLDGVVNGFNPTVAIAIHTSSANEFSPADGTPLEPEGATGTEAWHTVGGYDDLGSRLLANLLSLNISGRLGIVNRGVKLETDHGGGGLYIHNWNAPSAWVGLGFLEGDGELLRLRERDFARSVAEATISFLGLPITCADWAQPTSINLGAYIVSDVGNNTLSLRNDGLVTWNPGDYNLRNVANPYGAAVTYELAGPIAVGEEVQWTIPVSAPTVTGIHKQVWQFYRGETAVGSEAGITLFVLPIEARELKEKMEGQIEAWRVQGEQEVDKLIDQLAAQLADVAKQEAQNQLDQACSAPALGIGLVIGGVFLGKRGRKRIKQKAKDVMRDS